jgi:N-acetylmuramoyl-L-alanine amidase
MLILHYTGMPDAKGALTWLCHPGSEVSCHYFVFEDGRILQLVEEARRAWHAGLSCWEGDKDINSRSIGIEIANPGPDGAAPQFSEAQMAAVERLCADILERHRIASRHVLGHSDVSVGRKIDPGVHFDWARLARAGVGLWAEAPAPGEAVIAEGETSAAAERLQGKLAAFGYCLAPSGTYDGATKAVVEAFQRHWRPARVDGLADASSLDVLDRLLEQREGQREGE